MNKLGHSVGAFLASSASVYILHKGFIGESLMVGGIILGSFLPDLDADYSYFNSKFPKIKKIYELLPKCDLTKHRGALLHSILTLIPFYMLSSNSFIFGCLIGIIGHHLLDMTTKQGLRYFYPFRTVIRIWN
jgi:inner membrane protein